jgi:hypothetical protein
MTDLIVRQIMDDVNHDDLATPGDFPEPPVTGLTYGRGGGTWSPVLPLLSTQINDIRGPVLIPYGTQGVPALMIGSNDTGFYRQGQITYLIASGGFSMAWHATGIQAWLPINMGGQPILAVADAFADTDALNRRTADARYARLTNPWFDFTPDPGWLSSTIRFRVLDNGKNLQIAGDIQAPLPAGARARMGVLPEGYRPTRACRTAGICSSGVLFGWAMFEVGPSGEIWVVWSIGDPPANGIGSINAIIPMD